MGPPEEEEGQIILKKKELEMGTEGHKQQEEGKGREGKGGRRGGEEKGGSFFFFSATYCVCVCGLYSDDVGSSTRVGLFNSEFNHGFWLGVGSGLVFYGSVIGWVGQRD